MCVRSGPICLYDQADSAQWNANTDIPWHKVPKLPAALERAIGQV